MERRLSAIFAADMVGYSRLMEADEMGTLRRLKSLHKQLIEPKLTQHRGRIVKTTGDGFLAEFPSVVDAVQCAVSIQRSTKTFEMDLPENECIQFRIGVNLGDVILEDDDIFGDGVNIAARLEQSATPGGICISGSAFDQIRSITDIGYKSLGEIKVKNIERLIRAYEVLLDPADAGKIIESDDLTEPGYLKAQTFHIPEKPSIAVLPFDNLSGNSEHDYIGDSLTENIIAQLAMLPDLIVIARNSAFTFKGRSVTIQDVAEKLSVRYVMEGSFQTAGNRMRVVAQLTDAHKGKHLWAERYDYEIDDLFAVQDDITRRLSEELDVRLTIGEQASHWRLEIQSPDLYRKLARGRAAFQLWTPEGHREAERLYGELYDENPGVAIFNRLMGWIYWQKRGAIPSIYQKGALKKAREYAKKASEIEGDSPTSDLYILLASLDLSEAKHEQAIAHVDKAQEIAPSASFVYETGGYVKVYSGPVEEGVAMLRLAMQLEPIYPMYVPAHLVYGLVNLGQFAEAKIIGEEVLAQKEDLVEKRWVLIWLIAMAVFQENIEEAKRYAKHLMSIQPDTTVSRIRNFSGHHNDLEFRDRVLAAMSDAGIPA